jgi:hypothetical protein
VKAPKRPCVCVVLDQSMIWEAYSDQPVELIIKNVDKQWIRHLETVVNQFEIDQVTSLLKDLEEYEVRLPGLAEVEKKHIKVKKSPKIKLQR